MHPVHALQRGFRVCEGGATWEFEITRTDGTTVDVRLDEHDDVVVIEADREAAGQTG